VLLFGAILVLVAGDVVGRAALADDDGAAADALAVATTDLPCAQRPFSILLTVRNVKNDRGTITVDLHGDDPERWKKKGGKLARLRFPAAAGETQVCVPVDGPGRYALAVYHDRDGDGKFDKTWIGLPDEPYGLSNDAPARLGNPRYEDVSFEVSGPQAPVFTTLN
jgi:uncharacterized protein (DUF2141 family)